MSRFSEGYALGWLNGVDDCGQALRNAGEWDALRALAAALSSEAGLGWESNLVARRASALLLTESMEDDSDGEKPERTAARGGQAQTKNARGKRRGFPPT